MSRKIKIFKILKMIISLCIVVALFLTIISCKEEMVKEEVVEEVREVVGEEEDEIIDSSGTKEEAPSVVEEETPEEIEWEGVKITPIEGLRFNKGTFYAEAGNPYGLEVGEKAGVFVKDAVEINGVMESSIGLRPEVIEVMQKKQIEEEQKFSYAFPINLEAVKGIKIEEILEAEVDDNSHLSFDGDYYPRPILAIKAPMGTKIYAPQTTDFLQINFWDTFSLDGTHQKKEWSFNFENLFKEDSFNDIKIDSRGLEINSCGLEVFLTEEEKRGRYEKELLSEAEIGNLLAEITEDEYVDYSADENMCSPVGEYQIIIRNYIWQSQIRKDYTFGLESLLSINDIKVFIYPN